MNSPQHRLILNITGWRHPVLIFYGMTVAYDKSINRGGLWCLVVREVLIKKLRSWHRPLLYMHKDTSSRFVNQYACVHTPIRVSNSTTRASRNLWLTYLVPGSTFMRLLPAERAIPSFCMWMFHLHFSDSPNFCPRPIRSQKHHDWGW